MNVTIKLPLNQNSMGILFLIITATGWSFQMTHATENHMWLVQVTDTLCSNISLYFVIEVHKSRVTLAFCYYFPNGYLSFNRSGEFTRGFVSVVPFSVKHVRRGRPIRLLETKYVGLDNVHPGVFIFVCPARSAILEIHLQTHLWMFYDLIDESLTTPVDLVHGFVLQPLLLLFDGAYA